MDEEDDKENELKEYLLTHETEEGFIFLGTEFDWAKDNGSID